MTLKEQIKPIIANSVFESDSVRTFIAVRHNQNEQNHILTISWFRIRPFWFSQQYQL